VFRPDCGRFYRSLVQRSEVERELSDELQFHLERRADDLAARGMARAEAMRTARLEFGSPEKYKEETRASRGSGSSTSFRSESALRAWRSLGKNRGSPPPPSPRLPSASAPTPRCSDVFDAVIRDLPVSHPEQLVVFDFQRTARFDGCVLRGLLPDGHVHRILESDVHAIS
jgi:hypothetical protein